MDMSSLVNFYSPYDLYHHGILGQKWGVRRYQNKDGTLTELGRKKYLKDVEQGKATEEERRAYEKTKEKVIIKGKASDIQKFRDELTNQEIEKALNRLNLDRRISLVKRDEKNGYDSINNVMKKIGDINNWIDTGFRTYNNYDKIYKLLKKKLG